MRELRPCKFSSENPLPKARISGSQPIFHQASSQAQTTFSPRNVLRQRFQNHRKTGCQALLRRDFCKIQYILPSSFLRLSRIRSKPRHFSAPRQDFLFPIACIKRFSLSQNCVLRRFTFITRTRCCRHTFLSEFGKYSCISFPLALFIGRFPENFSVFSLFTVFPFSRYSASRASFLLYQSQS